MGGFRRGDPVPTTPHHITHHFVHHKHRRVALTHPDGVIPKLRNTLYLTNLKPFSNQLYRSSFLPLFSPKQERSITEPAIRIKQDLTMSGAYRYLQRLAHEQPVIFFSLAIGGFGESISCFDSQFA